MLSNNMNTLEQDYKKFLNLYTENLNESTSKNSGNEAKIMSYIEKIYRRIEENTKKDERINSLVNRLSDKNHLEEEKFLRLNKTEIVEKENTKSIELQRIENQKNFLVRDNEKLKKKIAMKENEIREKNDIIDKLEKEKQISASQCKDLQVALHLKNAQYQIILNKTKNIYLQTEPTNNNMTPMVAERNPFERKLSYHQTNPFEKNIKESISTRSKDTLQTIKQIFQFKKK